MAPRKKQTKDGTGAGKKTAGRGKKEAAGAVAGLAGVSKPTGRSRRGAVAAAPTADIRRSRRLRKEEPLAEPAPDPRADEEDAGAPSEEKGPPPGPEKPKKKPPPRVDDSEDEDNADETTKDPKPGPADVGKTTSGKTSSSKTGPPSERTPAEEDPAPVLRILAEQFETNEIEFEGKRAKLTTRVQIQLDSITSSRLSYNAQFFLSRDPDADDDGELCGHLESWRIDKRTASRLSAAATWIAELLEPKLEKVHVNAKETAMCLQGLFDEDGDVRKKAVADAEVREGLQDNSLIFIQMIYFEDGFRRKGLLTPALSSYQNLLGLLPEWFAFAGCLILVPGKPDAYADAWSDKSREEAEGILNARYTREGYAVWSNVQVKKKPGEYIAFPVMGKITYYTYNGTLCDWAFPTGDAAGQYEFLIGGVVIPLVTSPARNGKVTYMEKFGTEPANNSTGAYELDLSLLNNFTAAWRPMHVKSDIFCSASLTLPDKVGRQINIGGWANDATYGIRLYWPDGKPGVWGVNDWQENVDELSLLNGRWYPTAMTMANGSILVMGGEEGSNGAPVPTLEVLPSPSGEVVYCDYLDRTDPYNLYPFLAVLPSGGIFVGYYNEARILDPVSLQTKQVLPDIPGAVNDFLGGRTYPFEGTSMILPQTAPYDDYMRVIICGGSIPGPEFALDNCVSIAPDEPNGNWTIERMPSKRVISCMTALPDGTYLILNGAHQGVAGFGLATDPNLNAVLYDPTKPVNYRMSVMANTTVARLYHSEGVLLDDGRVLVSGSDPEDVRAFALQEYRNEVFIPPYLMGGAPRPAFNLTNLDWSYGESVSFPVTPSQGGSAAGYRVSLIGAVSSTHGNSMGQRTYFPETSCSGTTCTVVAPPNANVCPPSWFQVFLLDENNIPSNATWVRIGGDPGELGNWPAVPGFDYPGMGTVQPIL